MTQAEVDAVIQRAVEFRHFYFRPDGPAPVAVAASLCFISVCVIRTLLGMCCTLSVPIDTRDQLIQSALTCLLVVVPD